GVLEQGPGGGGGGEPAYHRPGGRVSRPLSQQSAHVRPDDGGVDGHQRAVGVDAEQEVDDARQDQQRRGQGAHVLAPGQEIALGGPMSGQVRPDAGRGLGGGLRGVVGRRGDGGAGVLDGVGGGGGGGLGVQRASLPRIDR